MARELERLKSTSGESLRSSSRTTQSACSASRSSANTRLPSCCAVPASRTNCCIADAPRAYQASDEAVAEQVEVSRPSTPGYIDQAASGDRSAAAAMTISCRCQRTSITHRCAGCRSKCSRSSNRTAGDARACGADLRRDARRDLAAARASEARIAAQRRRQRGRALGMTRSRWRMPATPRSDVADSAA